VRRWLPFAPLVVLVALGALFGFYALRHDPHVEPRALVGKPLPDLTLPAFEDGRPVKLRDLARNGPVVVNFFASWCAPCAVEAPELMKLKQAGVSIVGIAYEDVPPRGSPEQTQAFLDRLGDPFARKLSDADGRAGIEFGVTGVPETYLVGADGMIHDKHTGPLEDDDVRALARRALTTR
jgi:cytochrome c biogenesis protein CcmG/thiol:disulfide interchange protein DsbE